MNNALYQMMLLPKGYTLDMIYGKDFCFEEFEKVVKNNSFSTLNLFFEDANDLADLKSKIETTSCFNAIKVIFHNSIEKQRKCDVLSFFGLKDGNVLLETCKWHPRFLLGEMKRNPISAFDIWEKYRSICETIYITSYGGGVKEEVLNWEKSDSSDVELAVVFPMYKVEQYLPECINSLLEWKAPYVRYVFVDDGSPDGCSEIVNRFKEKDDRIVLLKKENGGCASARQYGIDNTESRYIGFVDPDDYTDPSMFKKLLEKALNGSYEITYCGYKERYEDTGETKNVQEIMSLDYVEGTSDLIKKLNLLLYLRVAIWRGIYKRDLINRNNIKFHTELKRFDDLPFRFETFSCAKSIACVPERLYYYRLSRPGQDVSANDEKLYVHFDIFRLLDDFIRDNKPRQLYDYLQCVKLQTHFFALTKIKPELRKEYLEKARTDLLHNMNVAQTYCTYRKLLSRHELLFYFAIILRSELLTVFLIKREEKKQIASKQK